MKKQINIHWFRRDLRLTDNAALYHALRDGLPVLPVFIFDTNILHHLENKADARVEFIHTVITHMQAQLVEKGASLQVFHSTPAQAFQSLLAEYDIQNVYANEDFEVYALERDAAIAQLIKSANTPLLLFKDQVIMGKKEVVKDNGEPYTVFTPYSKKWKATLTPFHLKEYPNEKYFKNFLQQPPRAIPTLAELGFLPTGKRFPEQLIHKDIIKQYAKQRDIPGIGGTSRLGLHLRFGTLSIRLLVTVAAGLSEVYLSELIWRDFYQMILANFPQVGKGKAFKPAYDHIQWRNNEEEFTRWCNGVTGYPIVDAGIRELNQTGFMHNRVRMITASFLCKHLLVDWRWGEAYFAEKLLDYDLAANNGGWQWAAGSGCDAAPYFRIFNPYLQTEKFDHDRKYIRKWVPEFESPEYPAPIVEHKFARERCLKVYKEALNENRL